jgi:hypothetical protein
MTLHSINTEQRLYVMPSGSGYSCLGFEVAQRKARAVAEWIGRPEMVTATPGTADAFAEYETIMEAGAEHAVATKTKCPAELTPQLVGLEGCRVEVVDAYDERRRFWVGRSTGWMPAHLEIARADSISGPAVSGAPFKSVAVVRRR